MDSILLLQESGLPETCSYVLIYRPLNFTIMKLHFNFYSLTFIFQMMIAGIKSSTNNLRQLANGKVITWAQRSSIDVLILQHGALEKRLEERFKQNCRALPSSKTTGVSFSSVEVNLFEILCPPRQCPAYISEKMQSPRLCREHACDVACAI